MFKRIISIIMYVMVVLYVFILCDLFFRYSVIFDANRVVARSLNLVPFQTIWEYASGSNHQRASFAISNVLGNIVVFIPFGLFLQTIHKRKTFWKGVLIIAVVAVAIETVQYIFGLGASDIDDVILNTFGGVLGMLLYKLFRRVWMDESRTKAAVTIAAVVAGVPIAYLYFTTVFAHLRL